MNQSQTQTETKKENLKIRSSVYPEGYGTQEHFNSAWSHIHNETYRMYHERVKEERKLTAFNMN